MNSQEEIEGNVAGEIGFLLAITSQLFTTRIAQVLGETDLTFTQFSVLNHLAANPGASISDLAAAMEINQPGVSKVVQRLSEQGFVSVRPDPGHSRRKRVTVVGAGARAIAEANDVLAADGAGWFTDWSASDLTGFRDRLGQLSTWLDTNRLEPTSM